MSTYRWAKCCPFRYSVYGYMSENGDKSGNGHKFLCWSCIPICVECKSIGSNGLGANDAGLCLDCFIQQKINLTISEFRCYDCHGDLTRNGNQVTCECPKTWEFMWDNEKCSVSMIQDV